MAPAEGLVPATEKDGAPDWYEASLKTFVQAHLKSDNSRNSFSKQEKARVEKLYHPKYIVEAEAKLARDHRNEAEKVYGRLIKKLGFKNLKKKAREGIAKFNRFEFVQEKIKERLQEVEYEMYAAAQYSLERERDVDALLTYLESDQKWRFWAGWSKRFEEMRDGGVEAAQDKLKGDMASEKIVECSECVANG